MKLPVKQWHGEWCTVSCNKHGVACKGWLAMSRTETSAKETIVALQRKATSNWTFLANHTHWALTLNVSNARLSLHPRCWQRCWDHVSLLWNLALELWIGQKLLLGPWDWRFRVLSWDCWLLCSHVGILLEKWGPYLYFEAGYCHLSQCATELQGFKWQAPPKRLQSNLNTL